MSIPFGYIIFAAWILWAAYWAFSSADVKHATRVESRQSRFLKYSLPIIVAVILLQPLPWFQGTVLADRFMPDASWVLWLGLLLTIAGLLFACWARSVLGRNWSGVVQIKQDHELITRGPYRLVRHPIYTGLLLAFLGSAIALGQWRGLLALIIIGASFWRKWRLEEHWMKEQFGATYTDYMQRTKAIVPWLF